MFLYLVFRFCLVWFLWINYLLSSLWSIIMVFFSQKFVSTSYNYFPFCFPFFPINIYFGLFSNIEGFLQMTDSWLLVFKCEAPQNRCKLLISGLVDLTIVSRECMFLGSLSRHNKDLEQRTLKPSAHHSCRVLDKPCYSSQANQCYSSILFRRQQENPRLEEKRVEECMGREKERERERARI